MVDDIWTDFSFSPETDTSAFSFLLFNCNMAPLKTRYKRGLHIWPGPRPSGCPLSVGDSHHADSLRKYCVHHVLFSFSSPLWLHVIYTVPRWDRTDLLPLWFFRLQSWMVLIHDAIWKGELYEVLNIHEFPVAQLHFELYQVPLWEKAKVAFFSPLNGFNTTVRLG